MRTREQKIAATERSKSLQSVHKCKKRELQDKTLVELERLQSVSESRNFYKQIKNQRRGFNPQLSICRAVDGSLLTMKHDAFSRFKELFDSLYNEVGEGSGSPSNLSNGKGLKTPQPRPTDKGNTPKFRPMGKV